MKQLELVNEVKKMQKIGKCCISYSETSIFFTSVSFALDTFHSSQSKKGIFWGAKMSILVPVDVDAFISLVL